MKAIIVDVDGTLALRGDHPGVRDWFDYTRVREDQVNWPVAEIVQREALHGLHVVVMSGREDSCREMTLEWLRVAAGVSPLRLCMRSTGDYRPDSVVKWELYDREVRPLKLEVQYVLDDRDSVVRMWREQLGMTCLQVAPGNF